MGRQVVRGEGAGQLVFAEGLEVASDGKVPRPAFAPCEGAVGYLPDERLHEPILAALGRTLIGIELEQLAPNHPPEPTLQLVRFALAGGRQARQGEGLSENRGSLHQFAVDRVKAVEARGDQRSERLGDPQLPQLSDRAVRPVGGPQAAIGDRARTISTA